MGQIETSSSIGLEICDERRIRKEFWISRHLIRNCVSLIRMYCNEKRSIGYNANCRIVARDKETFDMRENRKAESQNRDDKKGPPLCIK